jgi:hypothetical protein
VRIDEFSNMGAGVSGLSDTERTRFACFGFDIASGVPQVIIGLLSMALAIGLPGVAAAMAAPSMTVTACLPSISVVKD